MSNKKIKIGMLGAGSISGIYLKNLMGLFLETEIYGICDIITEAAEKAQKEYNIPMLYERLEDMLADPQIEIILNLTRPSEHYKVVKAALLAGKNVYTEKPLAETYEEGKELLDLAESKGLLLGSAPDTFLGAAIQSCRKYIDDGLIGEVVGAEARMISRGPEDWHPAPDFFYKKGGGPMMDMGPYYITALINLIGGVKSVTGMGRKSFKERIITSEPKKGGIIDVEIPTYVTGILEFESGALGNVTTTFDVYYDRQDFLEIYGSRGTLRVPDPNNFGGKIMIYRPEEGNFKELPILFDYEENSRGIGVADMARALKDKRKYRADAKQALHVLEILNAFEKSSQQGRRIVLESNFFRGEPMKKGDLIGILDS